MYGPVADTGVVPTSLSGVPSGMTTASGDARLTRNSGSFRVR